MKLEKKKDAEIARRQGMTKQTIIQIVWFTISAIISYFLLTFLLNSDEISFSYGMIYGALGISRNTIPEGAILAILILIMVFFFQIFLWLGFMFASEEGRRQTGRASLHSQNYDPNDYH